MRIRLVGINARFSHSNPALFYLRHALAKHLPGCVTEICQYTINDPYYLLALRLAADSPDYYFFSTLVWNSDLCAKLISDLHRLGGASRFVVGGPQARIVGGQLADLDRLTVFEGDIEAAGPEFYQGLARGTPNRFYRGFFLESGLKELPFPYLAEDFSGPLKERQIYYESSRGCPYNCTYCLSSSQSGVFHKPLEQVFEELCLILAQRPKVVRFVDRTFNDDRTRTLKIWKFLRDHGGRTRFHFEIAPQLFDEEMFGFLATVEPGCFQFELGIQSTNPATLRAIRRPLDPARAGAVIRRLRELDNIHLHADLIIGLPEEDEQSFERSFNEVFRMQPHYIQMGLLKLLPDTPARERAAQQGYLYSAAPPYSVFANRWLAAERLAKLYWFGECVEKNLNNRYFVSVWRYFAGCREDMALFFKELAELFLARGYLWNAATQETLSQLLAEHCRNRSDGLLVQELLGYDWLRCGHRYLPEHLRGDAEPLDELRRRLYRELPESLEGIYDQADRKQFFKKGVFRIFGRHSLAAAGHHIDASRAVVRFGTEREHSVFRLHQAQVVLEYD